MQISSPSINVRGVTSGAVPGLHADRPRRRLRVVADLGRRRHHRHLRRDAVRRLQAQVPLQGQVPHDGEGQRRHDHQGRRARSTAVFYRTVHGPVIGYARNRDRRASCVALSRKRSSYGTRDRRPAVQPADDVRPRQERRATSSTPRRRRRRRSTRSTRTRRSRRSTPSGALPKRPKGVNPTLPVERHRQATSGRACCRRPSTRRSSTRPAG